MRHPPLSGGRTALSAAAILFLAAATGGCISHRMGHYDAAAIPAQLRAGVATRRALVEHLGNPDRQTPTTWTYVEPNTIGAKCLASYYLAGLTIGHTATQTRLYTFTFRPDGRLAKCEIHDTDLATHYWHFWPF